MEATRKLKSGVIVAPLAPMKAPVPPVTAKLLKLPAGDPGGAGPPVNPDIIMVKETLLSTMEPRMTAIKKLNASPGRKLGAYLARGAFQEFKRRVDYAEYGGAPLLRLNGVCIICHGRSPAKAIYNAIRIAREFAAGKVDERIASELGTLTSA